MTKNEYLTRLRSALEQIKVKNIEDILADYTEHFNHGLAEGKSEYEISTKLGNPETVAKAFETESLIHEIQDPEQPFSIGKAFKILGRLIVLAPFNFLMLCIPGSIIFVMLITGWSMCLGFISGGVGVLYFSLQSHILGISNWMAASLLTGSFGLITLSIIFGLSMFFISKNVILLAINYLQWNLKFILEK